MDFCSFRIKFVAFREGRDRRIPQTGHSAGTYVKGTVSPSLSKPYANYILTRRVNGLKCQTEMKDLYGEINC